MVRVVLCPVIAELVYIVCSFKLHYIYMYNTIHHDLVIACRLAVKGIAYIMCIVWIVKNVQLVESADSRGKCILFLWIAYVMSGRFVSCRSLYFYINDIVLFTCINLHIYFQSKFIDVHLNLLLSEFVLKSLHTALLECVTIKWIVCMMLEWNERKPFFMCVFFLMFSCV